MAINLTQSNKDWELYAGIGFINEPMYYTCGRGKNAYKIYNLPMGFDIETTNNAETESAFMYHWQLSICNNVLAGRNWDSFFNCLLYLKSKLQTANVLIFIHNMGFEMSFLLPLLESRNDLERVFAKSAHHPLEVVTKSGFIFRDTQALTNMSLSTLAKTYCKTQKLSGDLDYSIMRNSTTVLTPEEKNYCINDVLILAEYAEQLHAEYTINKKKIPLTSTGIVRNAIKSNIPSNRMKYIKKDIAKLYPDTLDKYNFTMRWLFRGGYTHAQTRICGDIIEDVKSYDLTSAYPATMLHNSFPMTPYKPIKNKNDWQTAINTGKSVIGIYTFINIRATQHQVIESKHKCIDFKNAYWENGRLLKADSLTVFLTEIDLEIYKLFYQWDDMQIIKAKSCIKKPLPNWFIKSILQFYGDKKHYKDLYVSEPDPDKQFEIGKQLMASKNKLNALYGVTVSHLNTTEIVYKDGEYSEEKGEEYSTIISKQILSCYWGIYVTAYCRLSILSALYDVGADGLYSDTDSIKMIGEHDDYFNTYNQYVTNKNKVLSDIYNLDFEKYNDIGLFLYEGTYSKFKSYGAKRYIYTEKGKTVGVIAGLPKETIFDFVKKNGEDSLYDLFSPSMSFEISGKNAHKYHKETTAVINGEEMHELGGCYIYSIPFSMTVEKAFLNSIYERKKA